MYKVAMILCALTCFVPGCGTAGVYDGDFGGEVKSESRTTSEKTESRPASAGSAADRGALAAPSEQLQRKIIYNLGLDLVVGDFSGLQQKIEDIVRGSPQAYISAAAVSGVKGTHRSGEWTIRVPQDQYDRLVESLRALGEVTREQKTSQEVTEEFYDLQSRLKNKQETEKRLLKLQQERTGDLKDIVSIEEQIDRVREEIERMQGRLNRLENLTSLVTITLRVVEIRDYQPDTTISFGTRATSTFQSSWAGLKEFGEGLALAGIALAPWSPLLLAFGYLIWNMVRRWRRRAMQPKPVS
jgi:hypothetical protein